MADIILEHITKVYPPSVTAVKDVSLTFQEGEFVVFVGPSGCGKSTMLRMIAGLEEITQGSLTMDNRVVNTLSPKDRNIAMVFQNYALYPHMSVFDNMAFHLKIQEMSKKEIRQIVEETASLLEISPLLQRKPKQLSGGQRQRVALGRAMVRSPKVFLLDEPLSNLDATLRVSMRLEIMKLHKELRKNGTTFLYVTHDQVEAMTMGSRIVVLKDGEVQQFATPNDLYHFPANIFVSQFIGNVKMNVFSGEKRGDAFALAEGKLPLSTRGFIPENSVFCGIRPEHIRISSEKHPESMEFTIRHIENTGDAKILYGDSPLGEVRVKTGEDSFHPEKAYYIHFPFHQCHFFSSAKNRISTHPMEDFS